MGVVLLSRKAKAKLFKIYFECDSYKHRTKILNFEDKKMKKDFQFKNKTLFIKGWFLSISLNK